MAHLADTELVAGAPLPPGDRRRESHAGRLRPGCLGGQTRLCAPQAQAVARNASPPARGELRAAEGPCRSRLRAHRAATPNAAACRCAQMLEGFTDHAESHARQIEAIREEYKAAKAQNAQRRPRTATLHYWVMPNPFSSARPPVAVRPRPEPGGAARVRGHEPEHRRAPRPVLLRGGGSDSLPARIRLFHRQPVQPGHFRHRQFRHGSRPWPISPSRAQVRGAEQRLFRRPHRRDGARQGAEVVRLAKSGASRSTRRRLASSSGASGPLVAMVQAETSTGMYNQVQAAARRPTKWTRW